MRPVIARYRVSPFISQKSRTKLTFLLMLTFRLSLQDSEINVYVLGLVAYGAENIIPAIELAASESNELYGPRVSFNYSVYGTRKSGDFCDGYTAVISDYLGEFYYRKLKTNKRDHFIFLPTGMSSLRSMIYSIISFNFFIPHLRMQCGNCIHIGIIARYLVKPRKNA